MATRWGINRTVARIFALLYVTPRPINADEIAELLSVARSNVSTSLRELQSWGIINTVHLHGDRRDHFETLRDVWEIFRVILDERKRRESDPTLAVLRECLTEANQSQLADRHTHERLGQLHELFQTLTVWYEQVRPLPTETIRSVMSMGDSIALMANSFQGSRTG